MTQRTIRKIVIAAIIVCLLGMGLPAKASCKDFCCTQSVPLGAHPLLKSKAQDPSSGCCCGSEDNPCQRMLDNGSEMKVYGIVSLFSGKISESTRHTRSTADIIPSHHVSQYRATPGRRPTMAPSVPVYLTKLSLLI